jgi:hypothetical protein
MLKEDTGFKVSTKKTKPIMFTRRKFPITTRLRMNIWAKEEKIEQVRQHRILGLTFDTRMNWLEHNKNTKARAEKKIKLIKYLAHTTWGARGSRKQIESTLNKSPRYTEVRTRSIRINYRSSVEEIRTDKQ